MTQRARGSKTQQAGEPSTRKAGATSGNGAANGDVRRSNRRITTPTVIQMEAVECGAAALAIVLGHYGKFVPLEELRTVCGVSRDGARASNIVAAARSYGLETKGLQMETEVLWSTPKPVIIFWAFQHFMVVERIRTRFGRTTVFLNDPSSGRKTMSWEEFDLGFTGITLTFAPGPDFRRDGRPSRLLDALLQRRQATGGALTLVLLASLLLVVPGILIPTFSRIFIDRILAGGGATTFLIPLLATMACAALATFVLTFVLQNQVLLIQIKISLVSSARFFRHLLRLPVEFFGQRRPAELAKRVSANDVVAEILARDVATTVVNLVLVVFYAAILFGYDVFLSVIGIGMALLNVAVLRWVARIRTDGVAKLRAEQGSLAATSFNTLQLIETVKASGAEHDAFGRWAGFQAKVIVGQQQLGVPTALLTAVPPMLALLNTGVILLAGGLRVAEGAVTIGILVAFQSLLNGLTRPVTQITNLGERLQDVTADITRLRDAERYPEASAFRLDADATIEPLDGFLDVREVTFGYAPLAPAILRGVSFELPPGRRIALVGGSGSGKSTVGRLVAGLYKPWSGEIRIDGRRLEEISRAALTCSVSFVDQDIFLFEGTVRENLTLWDETVSEEAVVAALQDAAIYDEIAVRPGGIDGQVSEGGRNFSGGQRQRLEIARALVLQPTLLVMDEAMSALDAETERIIDDNVRRRGCACLIIAHRLSTVRDADEIIVLVDGEIVQRGRHDELMDAGGPYADLIAAS